MRTNNEEKMSYSVREVADILEVTRQTVYKLIKAKEFPAIQFDKTYRIPKWDFDKWLDGEEV